MGDKRTILVLDDEADTVALCTRVLRQDYNTIEATSGAQAIDLVRGRDVAAAVVDQRMPGMTGLEFLREFRNSHPYAGRVVMTAYTELDDIMSLINEGHIHGFVLKPWNNHQLRLTVAREVENHVKSLEIESLNARIRREHRDMLELLQALDPEFTVPKDNDELKNTKGRLRGRVSREVESLFIEQLLHNSKGNIAAACRETGINRTFLYRLMKRHGFLEEGDDTNSSSRLS